MIEIRVSNWNELNEALYEGSWNPELQRYRANAIFRGVANASFDLQTSLIRLRQDYVARAEAGKLRNLERSMLRNFRKYAHRDVAAGDSEWNWLAVAQHHGLPTRLLDWTGSPHVAVHFATDLLEYMKQDGAIWCVDIVEANRFLPERLAEILRKENANFFTAEMLGRAARDMDEFDTLSRESGEFVAFFEPPSLDDRVVNQFALFSVMSGPMGRLDAWLVKRPNLLRKIIIPAALKWELRDKLDMANITERMLFPGPDGLSRWLKRYYSPGPARAGA